MKPSRRVCEDRLRCAFGAALFALAAATTQAQPASPAGGGTCRAVHARAPNAAAQQPAFPGQTRACAVRSGVAYQISVVARGLEQPWAVEPLPDGRFLVTEKAGTMRVVAANGDVGPPLGGVPAVVARGQGGLLDVALGPTFASDRVVFWSYSEPRDGGNATSVARGNLAADGSRLDNVRVVFRAQPAYDGDKHFGSRLAFGPDGKLYVTLGDRSDRPMRPQAQALSSHMGKVIRIDPDGKPPADNPFVGRAGALPEIWSVGQRNVQAAAFDAQGRLWIVEHGTRGGDELNLIEKGKNYGWPVIAYGIEYGGSPINDGNTARAGLEQPIYYWDPVIAPSGAQWYDGAAFPAWRGSLFVGALRDQALVRLVVENGRVIGEERLLEDRGQRIRDVRQGPDGALYVVTDSRSGELWRIAPPR